MWFRDEFDDAFELPDGSLELSHTWTAAAERRKALIDKYCWYAPLFFLFLMVTYRVLL